MKQLLVIMIMSLGLTGCVPDISGDTSVDNSINNGTVLNCPDGNCSVSSNQDPSSGDAVVGVFDPDYTQAECNAAGYFYCTLDNICVDSPLESGTCPAH